MNLAGTDFLHNTHHKEKFSDIFNRLIKLIKILSNILQNNKRHFNEYETAKYEKEYFSI
jgi:hypothetical protein